MTSYQDRADERRAVLAECAVEGCGHAEKQHHHFEAVPQLAPAMTHCKACFEGTDVEHSHFTHDYESREAALARLLHHDVDA